MKEFHERKPLSDAPGVDMSQGLKLEKRLRPNRQARPQPRTSPLLREVNYMGNNVSFQHKSFAISHCWETTRCTLCGPVTQNTVKFEAYFGSDDDQVLKVCRWCLEDLQLLRFKINQILPFRTQQAMMAQQPAD